MECPVCGNEVPAKAIVSEEDIRNAESIVLTHKLQKARRTVDEGVKKGAFDRSKRDELDQRVETILTMFKEDVGVRHESWPDFERLYMVVRRKLDN